MTRDSESRCLSLMTELDEETEATSAHSTSGADACAQDGSVVELVEGQAKTRDRDMTWRVVKSDSLGLGDFNTNGKQIEAGKKCKTAV